MEIDRRDDVVDVEQHQLVVGEQLHLPASETCIDAELSRGRDEVLLEDLERDDPGPGEPLLGEQLERRCLDGASAASV
jgi:hypothetical protein